MKARVAVAASNTLAAEAGVRLAALGGGAVDSALAAVLVAMVCEPGVCAPGAGAYVTVAPADGSPPITVDGNVEMPGRGLPPERFRRGVRDVHTDYGSGDLVMTVGHGSVATPGALAAYAEVHRRHGRAPWAEVVAPAREAARDGFPLGLASASYLAYVSETVFGWHPDSYAALHHADGTALGRGEIVRLPVLADSLAVIAEEGAEALYRGDLAQLIAADMAANDGILTAADLAAYEPVVRPALDVEVGGWRLAINPPPVIGGTTLAAMLMLLEPSESSDLGRLLAVQEAVLRFRFDVLDLARDRAEAAADLLGRVRSRGSLAVGGPASTVHVSVVDSEGCACAVTASAGYGSGVMTPGTGIWLNNCLGEPELNRHGLHALTPGERLPSNMAPSVGLGPDGERLAIGSPGADRITTALLQVLTAVAAGVPLQDAIDQPRAHVRVLADGAAVLEYEEGLVPPADLQWPAREHPPHSMYFGGVGAALLTRDGRLEAAGDPRRAAVVAVGPESS